MKILEIGLKKTYRIARKFRKYHMHKSTRFDWQGRTDSYGYAALLIQLLVTHLTRKVHLDAFARANKCTIAVSEKHEMASIYKYIPSSVSI